MLDSILVISFLLLLTILFCLKTQGLQFFNVFFQYIFSENYSLSFFKYKQKIHLVDVFLGLFFLLQASLFLYLLGVQFPFSVASQLLEFLILLAITTLFFLLKVILYQTIKPLISNRKAVDYYGFNYAYWTFYFGIILFVVNLFLVAKQFEIPSWLPLLLVAIFYLFLIIRLISISLRYKLLGSVYIFLYFCALEIAPLAIVAIGFMRFLT